MADRTVAERLFVAAIVAGSALASATPYMYYVTKIAFVDRVRDVLRGVPEQRILELDLISVALVVTISAIAGGLFSERYGLPGIGDRAKIASALPSIVAFGLVAMVASYLLFGRPLAAAVPGYYPSSIGWALAMVAKGAVFDEVVARYGMMTIVSGVTRRKLVANAMQAAFFTAVGIKSMGFFGLPVDASFAFVGGVIASFFLHAAQGFVYARYGLFAAIALHAVIELKYVLHLVLV